MPVSGILDPAVTQLTGQLSTLAARITALERNQRSGYNQQNTSLDGGSLTINDNTGAPAIVIGQQSDGTFAVKQVGTVVPPLAPSTPIVLGGIGGVIVSWDGLMNDGSTPLLDFAATQVHVSVTANFTPSTGTLAGQMIGAGLFGIGGLTAGTTYYVALVAVNGAGQAGDPSAQASSSPAVIPAGVIPPGSITALQIQTGTITAAQLAAAAGILGSQIAGATITSANIFAGTITAALLAANLVVAGIVDATTITGSILRNSSTDPKTSINADGSITITNVSGVVIFKIESDGTIDWLSSSGTLMMKLSPGGTQLIYSSLTGPTGWDFEPPGYPLVLFSASSAVSSTTYANGVTTTATIPGSTINVVASCSGATAATGVTDTAGNVYTLVQSVTVNQQMQVFQCPNANVLTSHDSITVTYAAANTQEKNITAIATAGVLPSGSVTDFSSSANGSGTAISVSGTPSEYGDIVLMFVSNASAGGIPSAIPDGWTLLSQQHVATFQYTSIYYTANISAAAVTGSATIVSAAWSAVILGLDDNPVVPASSGSPAGINATLAASTVWSANGQMSLKITHSNTTANWGAQFPAFPVVAGTSVSMSCQIFTPAALASISIGFTFWSGPNGTGSNLGSASGDQGTLTTTTNGVYAVSISGAGVPAGAQSAVFFVNEAAADAVNAVYYIDAIAVPGGLVYSNSPIATTDPFGNSVPQGINFIGLPGLTNVFGVEDPFNNQLAGIDALGNINGQTISATTDVILGGTSLAQFLVAGSSGIVQRAYTPNGVWPSVALGTTETALLEIDFTIPAGHAYMLEVFPADFLTTAAAGIQHVFRLKYTTDGTTPSTTVGGSVTEVAGKSPSIVTISTASKNYMSPYISWIPATPGADTPYRVLLSANLQTAGTFQFQTPIELRVTDLGVDNGQFIQSGVVLGSGTTGGSGGAQTKTEYFYGHQTWSYYSGGAQRNHNSTIYQGSPSGAGSAWNIGYIQWDTGSLGNSLATVLTSFGVNSVKLRLLNTGSYFSYGMTVGLHSSTVLGSPGYSSILDFWNIAEGQLLTHTLGSSAWAPFATGGTYAVIAPTSVNNTNLNWWGNFWGGGTNNAKVPAMIVNWTH
jgi:hypothetical protein